MNEICFCKLVVAEIINNPLFMEPSSTQQPTPWPDPRPAESNTSHHHFKMQFIFIIWLWLMSQAVRFPEIMGTFLVTVVHTPSCTALIHPSYIYIHTHTHICACVYVCVWTNETNFMALSPQANYIDWVTDNCRRNLVPTFADRGVWRGQCSRTPTVVNLSFLDRSRYFSFK
jgi:hypothetical protein